LHEAVACRDASGVRTARLINAVDLHACGEHGRVITGGVLDVPGDTMFDKMTHLRDHADWLRKVMLREPRGYPAANVNLILPSNHPEAQAGYVIMEQIEYPPMSGTNTICVVTTLIETGMVDGRCTGVTFRNVPAFAVHLDQPVEVPQLGTVTVDVGWGGMFYVIADASQFGFALTPDEGADLTRTTEMIKAATREQLPGVVHPENPEIHDVTIGQLYGPPHRPDAARRNVVTVSTGAFDWDRPSTWTGAIDRSPCGTGTCAAMAVLHAKGRLAIGQDFVHEGILGTVFTGRLVEETRVGDRSAVVPTITGQAWITGYANYVIDPDDPFPEGFTVGDIWA
jgi:proline racemase